MLLHRSQFAFIFASFLCVCAKAVSLFISCSARLLAVSCWNIPVFLCLSSCWLFSMIFSPHVQTQSVLGAGWQLHLIGSTNFRDRLIGWWGRSVGRASDSRSKDPRFEPRQEHKNNLWAFFRVWIVVLTRRRALPPCVYWRIRQSSSVDYGNTKRPTQHALVGLGSTAFADVVALPR